jgi:ribulose-5-phosphate 4-epimerase/fuculose-1-phosphate aldolase
MSEGAIREEIVRWGKSLFERGVTSGSSGNISVRTPDGYLAAPTNSCLEFLEPDRLSKLDAEGRHISGTCLRRNCLSILASDANFLHPPARNFLAEAIRCRWADCHS